MNLKIYRNKLSDKCRDEILGDPEAAIEKYYPIPISYTEIENEPEKEIIKKQLRKLMKEQETESVLIGIKIILQLYPDIFDFISDRSIPKAIKPLANALRARWEIHKRECPMRPIREYSQDEIGEYFSQNKEVEKLMGLVEF